MKLKLYQNIKEIPLRGKMELFITTTKCKEIYSICCLKTTFTTTELFNKFPMSFYDCLLKVSCRNPSTVLNHRSVGSYLPILR